MISIQNEIINLDDDIDEELDQKPRGPIRAEGEFSIDSLPPIEDLKISVPEDECVVLGKVMSIVDQLGKHFIPPIMSNTLPKLQRNFFFQLSLIHCRNQYPSTSIRFCFWIKEPNHWVTFSMC